ncbi:tripartite tricarboxylate transporter permease [Hyphomicrobium sp. CS1BSMeth3]|uniref:tripartite tricarboxylate transporter permease n=1 Tax=Hyphomicrobium sp. CS1BSMeth3 TaxID=1892844 RepID=UPI000931929A|nr:tripartite tricarboxylate transporter permease [Hyphomicrobium sp. CS1BSMeth3]
MALDGLLANLALGLSVAATMQNLMWCLMGAVIGTAVGVLPGVGPVATMALLLPVTYVLPADGALIMLAGIYYGAQYGGSTTAILVNLPGESSSVVTTLDGYQMARQGRAGPALAIAAIGSFFAGCVATILIAAAAPPLTRLAQQFAPADYFSLMVLGLVFSIVLARGSIIKAFGMVFLGMLLGLVGTDVNTGNLRFTFGISDLFDGLGFVPLAMGIFGIAEIIANLTNPERRDLVSSKVSNLWPSREDFRRSRGPILRGTILGSVLGLLPGGGAVLGSFSAYTLEKKVSKTPEKFGTGMIEGVAGPESANNAAAQTSFIPMLTLGIPSNAVMAMMIGGMMIHGIIPGPQVMEQRPGLFWGMIVSMWFGNLMLIILNLPMIGLWVRLLLVPYRLLAIAVLFFCCIGVYSLNNSANEVLFIAGFGLLGYLLIKLDCEPAPLLLGFILGPMMEVYMRRAMLLSRGDPWVFFQRPLSFAFLVLAGILLLLVVLPAIRKGRETAFQE